jgi:hypothetical protein
MVRSRLRKRWYRYRRPEVLTTAVALLLLVAAAGLASLTPATLWVSAYLLFVVITIVAVRAVPIEPGSWMRRRPVRRALVLLIVAACLTTAIAAQRMQGATFLIVLLLAFCDLALGRSTQRLATSPDERVDEWQEKLRDRSHRLAYWVLAAITIPVVLAAYVATTQTRSWLSVGLSGQLLVPFFELLFCLPAMVIAWSQPDPIFEFLAPPRKIAWLRGLVTAMAVIALVGPVVLSASVALWPLATVVHSEAAQASRCHYFRETSTAGIGVEAQHVTSAVVCWNGKRAHGLWGLSGADCGFVDAVMATARVIACRRTVSPSGTLTYTSCVEVHPSLLPFLTRVLSVELKVSRAGKVLWSQ